MAKQKDHKVLSTSSLIDMRYQDFTSVPECHVVIGNVLYVEMTEEFLKINTLYTKRQSCKISKYNIVQMY